MNDDITHCPTIQQYLLYIQFIMNIKSNIMNKSRKTNWQGTFPSFGLPKQKQKQTKNACQEFKVIC